MKLQFVFLLLATIGLAQDKESQISKAAFEGDTATWLKLLKEWEAESPNDLKMISAFGTYYYYQSIGYADSVKNAPPRESTNLLFVNGHAFWKAIEYLERAIKIAPDRFDFRIGILDFLSRVDSLSPFVNAILDVVERTKTNKKKWIFENGNTLENEYILLVILEKYVEAIYGYSGNITVSVRQIAEAILEQYPLHFRSILNIGRSYGLEWKFSEALPYIQRAYKLQPKEPDAIMYMALCYDGLEDYENAKLYYKEILQSGNEVQREMAKERLQAMSIH